jgi:hypothetical protein
LSLMYSGVLMSLTIGTQFRRPLIDPSSRWGIFSKRQQRRPRLRDLIVCIALISPGFAFMAQLLREQRIESEAWAAERIASYSKEEEASLARAREAERLAAECRQGDAAASSIRAAEAKSHDESAAFWRRQADWAREGRKNWER